MIDQFYGHAERAISALRFTRRISKQLAPLGFLSKPVSISYENNGFPLYDMRIERSGSHYRIIFQSGVDLKIIRQMVKMVSAYIYWLSLCPPEITSITVNGSDGERVSQARFTPSSRTLHHIPIVDPHFFHHRGFETDRQAGRSSPSWAQRTDDITWRGALSGVGWLNCNMQDRLDPSVMHRIRLAMALIDEPNVDVKLVGWKNIDPAFRHDAGNLGILGQPIPSQQWLTKKYAIDIDGATNTWSNLIVRMLHGCCVLKVGSQFGYRQWYYDQLKPWEHFVPLKTDLSDLKEKIEWVRSHDQEASQIALHGQQFAQSLTFDSQAKVAAHLIEAHRG
jgi:hypothetical protein